MVLKKLLGVVNFFVWPTLALLLLQPAIQTCQHKPQSAEANEVSFAPQPPDVLTHEGIDSVLAQFETIKFTELDTSYISYTDPLEKYRKKFKKMTYYVIEGRDVFTKIVGPYRVIHFLSRDKYYAENMNCIDGGIQQYWSADKEILHMLLDVILELDERGYNKYGFHITAGHRHPYYNMCCKGAAESQHQYGTAIDLAIKDINNDGKSTDDDKQIVLDILEEIVGDDGGLGLYPGSMSVHMDCRGYKARWNSYTSPY